MKHTFSRRGFLGTGFSAAAGSLVWSRAAMREEPLRLRFAIGSDGHFGQPETDFPKFHQEMINWLNLEVSGRGLDFVIFNGDLIHNQGEFLPGVKQAYDRLNVPYFCTKGNHDQVSDAEWEKVWGYGVNHDFTRSEFGFLLGTTSNQAGDYLCADLKWLSERLAAHRDRKGVFLFLHISQQKFTRHGIDCPEVARLLEGTENLRAVFHGHDHDIDNVIHWRGVRYLYDGHMGGNWGTNYRGYRIVEVDGDGSVKTYQCNPQGFYVNQQSL